MKRALEGGAELAVAEHHLVALQVEHVRRRVELVQQRKLQLARAQRLPQPRG